MSSLLSITIIMLIWTVSDFVSKKTKSLVSSLLVASLIFLVGFKSELLPPTILQDSSLLALGTTILGFIIIHIGTMIRLAEFKRHWRTVVIGVSATLGIVGALVLGAPLLGSLNYSIAAAAGVTGGTISVILAQDAALKFGLTSVAVLPVLITAFQGIIGFPLTSLILKREAQRIKREDDYHAIIETSDDNTKTILPESLQTTAGTLFIVGCVMLVATALSQLTKGVINEFVIALVLGVLLCELGILKRNILEGIDAYGLMMLSIMIIIFGPLGTISVHDLMDLALPLVLSFVIGVSGGSLAALFVGKLLGYSASISIAIGLTSLFGFPGTMILSQEAARSVGANDLEIEKIQAEIMPKMIIAGFSTVTITSVLVVGLLVSFIH